MIKKATMAQIRCLVTQTEETIECLSWQEKEAKTKEAKTLLSAAIELQQQSVSKLRRILVEGSMMEETLLAKIKYNWECPVCQRHVDAKKDELETKQFWDEEIGNTAMKVTCVCGCEYRVTTDYRQL